MRAFILPVAIGKLAEVRVQVIYKEKSDLSVGHDELFEDPSFPSKNI